MQAKMMHISMCVRRASLESIPAVEDRYLMLLTNLVQIPAHFNAHPHDMEAFNQALPGV